MLLSLLGAVNRYKNHYKNAMSVMMAVKNNHYPIHAVKKNGTRVIFKNKYELHADLLDLRYENEIVTTKEGLQFYKGIENGNVYNVFYHEDYRFLLPVENKMVIDVGANIADSSIYFTHNGAKQVIALEPFTINYELAKHNVMLNKMQDKITLLNAGCAGKTGHMIIETSTAGVYAQVQESSSGQKVDMYSLADLVSKYDLDNAILKIDCEGCEYETILSSSVKTLNKFERIQIEYHNRGYKDLEYHLNGCGFEVSHTNPEKKRSEMYVGWIYATRP
jgi:FkbM family methyltransferase